MRSESWRLSLARRTALFGVASLFAPLAAPAVLADTKDPLPAEPAPPLEILFLGDSLAQGMFLSLNPLMRRRPTPRVINGTLHATGVTRSDEYDWTTVSRDLVARHHPQLVVYWIGANDFRPLVVRETRSRFAFGTQAFADLYAQRVTEMVGNAVQGGAKAAWLGLPNMRESQFAGAARQLNTIQQTAALAAGALWINTWDATSDTGGHFMATLPPEQAARPLRAEDGVHFTDLGYRRIGALLFEATATHFPELAPGLGRFEA